MPIDGEFMNTWWAHYKMKHCVISENDDPGFRVLKGIRVTETQVET